MGNEKEKDIESTHSHASQRLNKKSQESIYSGVQIRWQRVFWAENQGNHQNLTHPC